MQLLFRDSERPDDMMFELIRDEQRLKFAAFGTFSNGLVTLFPFRYEHASYIQHFIRKRVEGMIFIGAGHVIPYAEGRERPMVVEWGSESCRDKLGYDRPEGKAGIEEGVAHIIRAKLRPFIMEAADTERSPNITTSNRRA